MKPLDEDYVEVKTTLVLVLVLNLVVTLAKAVFGILANSLSMTADSLHSLFDSTSNIIGLVAVERASKPPDVEHPYGHRKYETFATLFVAFFLFITAFEILMGVFNRIRNPTVPEITLTTFLVMVSTLIINYFVARFEYDRGKQLHSSILVADSQHTKSDIYASISVIAGFVVVKLGYPIFDSLVASLIVILIARTGYNIIKGSSKILCDTSPLDHKEIQKIVYSISGIVECHKVRSRGIEDEVFVDLHIHLDPKTTLGDAHGISHLVEEKIKEKFKNIKDVVVHIEPAGKG